MGRGGPVREAHWGRGAKPLSRESERGSRGRSRGSMLGSVVVVWGAV